jgi:hypothetical protein
VQWQFLDPGYGWVKITGFTDAQHVTGDVISAVPTGAVGIAQATARWARQAWNATDGYPTCVTFFRERLVFARDATLWFSVAGDFQNFTYQIDGAVTADSGFDRTLSSDLANAIRWLSPGDVLLVGTLGDEWASSNPTPRPPSAPPTCKTARQSAYGSCFVAPERVADDTIFIQKSGRKARAMKFDFAQNGYASPDVTVYAEHVTRSRIVDMAFHAGAVERVVGVPRRRRADRAHVQPRAGRRRLAPRTRCQAPSSNASSASRRRAASATTCGPSCSTRSTA